MHDTVGWYSERVDDEGGEIHYEAHGPKDSFVVFEGPNAKHDCEVFMAAINADQLQSFSENRAHGGKLDLTGWQEREEGNDASC